MESRWVGSCARPAYALPRNTVLSRLSLPTVRSSRSRTTETVRSGAAFRSAVATCCVNCAGLRRSFASCVAGSKRPARRSDLKYGAQFMSTYRKLSDHQLEGRPLRTGPPRDRPAVALGHRLDDREAEPGAALVRARREEALEDSLLVGLADPGTVVAHRHHQPPVPSVHRDLHRSLAAVADGVLDQVLDGRVEVIGADRDPLRRPPQLERHRIAEPLRDRSEEAGDVHSIGGLGRAADPREVEERKSTRLNSSHSSTSYAV